MGNKNLACYSAISQNFQEPHLQNNNYDSDRDTGLLDNKNLYSLIKHNKTKTVFSDLLTLIPIEFFEKITVFNKSLIYWAVILENERLINDIFKEKLFIKQTFLKEVFEFNIKNKNPNILHSIMCQIKQLSPTEQHSLLLESAESISSYCFRTENISQIESILYNAFSAEEKNTFIKQAVKSNNIPLLTEINKKPHWHSIIYNIQEEIYPLVFDLHMATYKKIVQQNPLTEQCHILNQNKLLLESNGIMSEIPKSEANSHHGKSHIPSTLVVKRKRKIFS